MKHIFSRSRGFTLVELLVVITIIALLASLTIATMSSAQRSAARNRTKAEISGLTAAIESYKTDNGDYPRDTNTDTLNAKTRYTTGGTGDKDALTPAGAYMLPSLALYMALSGDTDLLGTPGDLVSGSPTEHNKIYFTFKATMLYPKVAQGTVRTSANQIQALADPFRNVYGYSTKYSADVQNNVPTPSGMNPTYDLWSTADFDQKGVSPCAAWLTNW